MASLGPGLRRQDRKARLEYPRALVDVNPDMGSPGSPEGIVVIPHECQECLEAPMQGTW